MMAAFVFFGSFIFVMPVSLLSSPILKKEFSVILRLESGRMVAYSADNGNIFEEFVLSGIYTVRVRV